MKRPHPDSRDDSSSSPATNRPQKRQKRNDSDGTNDNNSKSAPPQKAKINLQALKAKMKSRMASLKKKKKDPAAATADAKSGTGESRGNNANQGRGMKLDDASRKESAAKPPADADAMDVDMDIVAADSNNIAPTFTQKKSHSTQKKPKISFKMNLSASKKKNRKEEASVPGIDTKKNANNGITAEGTSSSATPSLSIFEKMEKQNSALTTNPLESSSTSTTKTQLKNTSENDEKPSQSASGAATTKHPTKTESPSAQNSDSVDPLDAFWATIAENPSTSAAGATVKREQTDSSQVKMESSTSAATSEDEFKKELLSAFTGDSPAAATTATEDEGKTSTTVQDEHEIMSDDEDDYLVTLASEQEALLNSRAAQAAARSNKKNLKPVDHSKVDYMPFRKNFFITPPEMAKLSTKQVKDLRKKMGGIKVRGDTCPPPIQNFRQCGLSENVIHLIEEEGYTEPFPIQSQAIPAIMSGRDTIGIARTGSGKTLAFILPMLRHVLDQPPLRAGDGPVALIIAPTRELAVQIHSEVAKFASVVDLRSMCAVGGASISHQIAALKRGSHIVVCTPGRMIELLCANRGKVTNLKRVTHVCLDEADRMFDLGFGPQITRIIGNIRPDKQVVMFSATFPKPLEALARNSMNDPLEIMAGGRSIASKNVKQFVEIRKDKKEKFFRLLEILGYWQNRGQILVFVDRQSECGVLFKQLVHAGYDVLVQHGGMDQIDRDHTMESFKKGEKSILIATSVLSRGLDVKGLELVINFDCPNHYEDYVHRVGRTGRAGKKGTAYTFITPDEDSYASNLVRALKLSGNVVPNDLRLMAEEYSKRTGKTKKKLRGYGGHGFKFDQSEQDRRKQHIQRQMVSLGLASADTTKKSADKKDDKKKKKEEEKKASTTTTGDAAAAEYTDEYELVDPQEAVRKAREYAMQLALQQLQKPVARAHSAEIDINDYPQKARSDITSREYLFQLNDRFGVNVTTRGVFVPPGNPIPEGETKLHLLLEGPTQDMVDRAKLKIEKEVESVSARFMEGQQMQNVGRYSVLA